MKKCLACHAAHDSSRRDCPICGAAPALIAGFDAYAPDLAHDSEGFKAHFFAELAQLEEKNFWFVVRNQIILWALKTYAPNINSFLEVGCGTGFVLAGINKEISSKIRLSGSEIFVNGLVFAAQRLPSAHFMQMDARKIPFAEEFGAIGIFDVLEHIEADEEVMRQIHKALRPEGMMLLSVPQHPWLWSAQDEHACHVQRYAATDLHRKVVSTGFKIIRSTSFVTALLPAMMASRYLQKEAEKISELKMNPLLNSLFEKIMRLEFFGMKLGINYPVGGSRFIVAQKI